MSKPETIKIDEVEYVRKDVVIQPQGDTKIVILQRGWVMIGKFQRCGNLARQLPASHATECLAR